MLTNHEICLLGTQLDDPFHTGKHASANKDNCSLKVHLREDGGKCKYFPLSFFLNVTYFSLKLQILQRLIIDGHF